MVNSETKNEILKEGEGRKAMSDDRQKGLKLLAEATSALTQYNQSNELDKLWLSVTNAEEAISIFEQREEVEEELAARSIQACSFIKAENEEGAMAALTSMLFVLLGIDTQRQPDPNKIAHYYEFIEEMLLIGASNKGWFNYWLAKLLIKIGGLRLLKFAINRFTSSTQRKAQIEKWQSEPTRKKEGSRAVAELTLAEGKKLTASGNWQRGLEYLQNALDKFRKLNDWDGIARSSLEIGTVQELFGDYEVAKLSFLDAERFFKKSKREEGLAVVELKLGTLALELYDYEKARKHLKLAADFFHQHGDQRRAELSDKFLNLADQYERELAPI